MTCCNIIKLILGKITPLNNNAFRSSSTHVRGGAATRQPSMSPTCPIGFKTYENRLYSQIDAFAYDVFSVRAGVVMHKQEFCAHGTAKQKGTCCFKMTGSIVVPVWLGSKRTRPPGVFPPPWTAFANASPD
ncbi:hypothetical protein TNCV_474361 [Trichonephila clavipes]|nr:hypothetical protein TNCV_474361 [Trichonephila clavipes]